MNESTPGSESERSYAATKHPVASEHSYVYVEAINGYQVVKCVRCGVYRSYRVVGYKPEPPKEPCYG